jgi:hypothetical protein
MNEFLLDVDVGRLQRHVPCTNPKTNIKKHSSSCIARIN